jgi:hypothetical protein
MCFKIRQKKIMRCRCAKKKVGGGGVLFLFFSPKSRKMQKFPRFARTTRESMQTSRESTRTTCRRHITREFWPKSRKKFGGVEIVKKNLAVGATVTRYFFFRPHIFLIKMSSLSSFSAVLSSFYTQKWL